VAAELLRAHRAGRFRDRLGRLPAQCGDDTQSAGFAEALRGAGADVRFTAVEGATHMWKGVADPEPLVRAALDFARTATSPS
jgi:acetyl esterase/lipase